MPFVNKAYSQDNVGIVETRLVQLPIPKGGLALENGGVLPELTVAYETYGKLNAAKNNAVYICHALSGDAHVAGFHGEQDEKPGWWDEMIGPGKGIDTNRFFVICSNILGGCKGTTGPSSRNPATGTAYGSRFPRITVGDIVTVQYLFLKQLGIDQLAAVVGGSLGGMQVLAWSIRHPEMVDTCICIASAASLSTQALAFDIVGRDAILTDPKWAGGDYYGAGEGPELGLAQARMIGHITYLSPEMMDKKFGREKDERAAPDRKFDTFFQVERYLHHQGRKFVTRFDANSYLHITEAMDSFDLAEEYGSIDKAFAGVRARFLVIALSADWLFPPEQSLEVATALLRAGKRVSYCLLHAPHGHDAFLVDIQHLAEVVRTFLGGGAAPVSRPAAPADHAIIRRMVGDSARTLDLGCGDGSLLALLAEGRPGVNLGIDIDLRNIIASLARGLDIFQGDIDEGLSMIPDASYDFVILSQTLQEMRKPQLVLREILRVARAGIISFPNFASWTNRLRLGVTGRMPKSSSLPYEWYETPNIHLTTLKDFLDLCRAEGITVEEVVCIPGCPLERLMIMLGLTNLGADRVLVKIARA